MSALTTTTGPAAWLRRYLPAELLAITATLAATGAALALTGSVLLAALAGTWAENLAYYGLMLARELRARGRSPRAALAALRDLLLEFGPAELLDSLLVRPAALYLAMAAAPTPLLGAAAGKLAADLIFYLPTIASYELLRRRRAAAEEVTP
jgi:hypothetical protein